MRVVNMQEAKTQLSKLIDAVSQGEQLVIAKSGKPAAMLVPLPAQKKAERTPGALRGEITMAEDFDAPLPEEVQHAFEGR